MILREKINIYSLAFKLPDNDSFLMSPRFISYILINFNNKKSLAFSEYYLYKNYKK